MATNRDLLTDAIADAKTIRETAIANAKLALEESFTPHLKSMLAAKLDEMEKEDDVKEVEDKIEEEVEEVSEKKEEKDDKIDEEIDLDELLSELEEAKKTRF